MLSGLKKELRRLKKADSRPWDATIPDETIAGANSEAREVEKRDISVVAIDDVFI